jgi:apolipoprotein N-acyltransferase
LTFWAAFPPFDAWPLALIAPALLTWMAIRAATARRAVAATGLTQFVMWLWMHRWLVDVSAPGWITLAVYMSIFGVMFTRLLRSAVNRPGLARWPMAMLLPVIWTGIECLRGELVFNGYPWFLIAHPFINAPLLVQTADLMGAYFVGSLAAAVSGVIVDALRWRNGELHRATVNRAAGLALLAVAAAAGYGWWRIEQREAFAPGPRVLAIQTNLPQDNKIGWTLEQQLHDVTHFMELTRAAAGNHAPSDLIVWPETMLPGFGLEPDTIEILAERRSIAARFPRDIADLARELGVPLLIGSPAFLGFEVHDDEPGWTAHFNSAYLVHGGPPYQRYDKHFLTPFGETMPYISAWPWLEQRLLDFGARGMTFDLDANPEIHLINVPARNGADGVNGFTIATPICFEDTMARVCRRMAYEGGRKRVDAIINLSNDGWFGSHDAGREQHVQIARFRCIENRVPMLRAANTGISVWIDSNGFVAGVIGSGRYGTGRVEGDLVAELQLDSRRTLYGRVGDVWAWLCLALTACITLRTMWPIRQGDSP